MPAPRLLTYPNDADALRIKAKRVKDFDKALLAVQAMKRIAFQWEQDNFGKCEGLAATQVGIPLRIIIIRKSDEMAPRKPTEGISLAEDTPEEGLRKLAEWKVYNEWMRNRASTYDPWHVIINPTFIKSEGTYEGEEGCLSVPGLVGKTVRPNNIVFRFYTLKNEHVYFDGGKKVYSNHTHPQLARDLAAACVDHEMKHLNGGLFIDEAYDIRKINPEDKVTL